MSDSQKTLKDIIKDEYIKCARSASYFMKKYCVIQHPTRGKIPFHLYQYQEEALTDCEIIEASTPHFNDRVRVEEKYGIFDESGMPSTSLDEIETR